MQEDSIDSDSDNVPGSMFGGTANFSDFTENHPEAIETEGNTDDDKLMKLVSSQNFDGSFKLETTFASLLDTTLDDIKQCTYINNLKLKVDFNVYNFSLQLDWNIRTVN